MMPQSRPHAHQLTHEHTFRPPTTAFLPPPPSPIDPRPYTPNRSTAILLLPPPPAVSATSDGAMGPGAMSTPTTPSVATAPAAGVPAAPSAPPASATAAAETAFVAGGASAGSADGNGAANGSGGGGGGLHGEEATGKLLKHLLHHFKPEFIRESRFGSV